MGQGVPVPLRRGSTASDFLCMSSIVSPAAWLQAAIAQSVHASPASTTSGRHRAPETPGAVEYLTSEQIAAGPGRHAEPEVDRFDRPGSAAAQD
jgi:hypothetical protein